LVSSRLARVVWKAWELYRKSQLGWQAELLTAIAKRSASLVHEQFGAPFAVLVWDDDGEPSRVMLAALRSAGLNILLVSDVIPVSDRAKYMIPLEAHPGAQANRLLAERLAKLVE